MDHIEPDRLDLAREFKAQPFGPHSRDLQKVLNIMRWMPKAGKPVIVCTKSYEEWCIGELPADRGTPVTVQHDRKYDDHGEAFWQVFKRRWQLLTGHELPVD
jgi:N,N-dimethylformamidase